MYRTQATVVAALGVITFAAASTRATVVYQDSFTATPGTLLNGHAPDVASGTDGGSATGTWTASTSTVGTGTTALWTLDGTGKASIGSTTSAAAASKDDGGLIANANLPFSPVAGNMYDLQITIAPDASTSTNWIGIAYANGNYNGHAVSGQAISNNNPYGLIIDRGTGGYATFGGVGTGAAGPTGTVTTTSGHVFDLVLDTSTTLWSMAWKVDGTQIGSYNYTANPAIGLISFGTNKHQGSVSAFSLTSTSVPEPVSGLVLGVPAMGLIRRRR